MNQISKLDKFFSEYLNQRISENKEDEIDYFISFNSHEDMESFIEDYGSRNKDLENSDKIKPFSVQSKFSIIPALFIRSSLNFLKNISKDDRILRIEGNYRIYLSLDENNDYDSIIHPDILQNSLFSPQGKGVKIAIFDSGIDQNHPDLLSKIKNRYDITSEEIKGSSIDLCGHGTMLAGIISGSGIGSDGKFRGIAPSCELIDVKIIDRSGIGYISDLLNGLEAIKDEQLDIILFGANAAIPNERFDIFSRACRIFAKKGIILISPVGNFGPDQGSIGTPALSDYVLSVGSIDNDQSIAFFSSRGMSKRNKIKPDLVLPGLKIYTTKSSSGILGTSLEENNLYCSISGTSASAAIFAGMVALIKEVNPKITQLALKSSLDASSKSLSLSTISQGFGKPDLIKLFENLNIPIKKPVQYKIIVKKSFILSIVILIIFIVLFYIAEFLLNFL